MYILLFYVKEEDIAVSVPESFQLNDKWFDVNAF